eukprot:scaffold62423_cov30-Tisochrysis_lutea.AAC.2
MGAGGCELPAASITADAAIGANAISLPQQLRQHLERSQQGLQAAPLGALLWQPPPTAVAIAILSSGSSEFRPSHRLDRSRWHCGGHLPARHDRSERRPARRSARSQRQIASGGTLRYPCHEKGSRWPSSPR